MKRIITPVLLVLLLSGCSYIKNPEQVQNDEKSKAIIPTKIISEFEGTDFLFTYPSDLALNPSKSTSGFILLSADYKGSGTDTPTWDEVKKGFKISVLVSAADPKLKDRWDTISWVRDEPFGKIISKENVIVDGVEDAVKIIQESEGIMALDYSDTHSLTTYHFLNSDATRYGQIWLLTKKSDNEAATKVLTGVIDSFHWN